MCNVRPYVTDEYDIIFCPNWCYMRKCIMSDHTRIWYVFCPKICYTCSDVICPNICYARNYDVLFPYLYNIRKCVMSKPMLDTKIWLLVSELMLHAKCIMSEYEIISSKLIVKYENVFCRNICHTRICDFFFPSLCYIRKYKTLERMLHAQIWWLVSELILQTKMYSVRTHVTHKNMMSRVRTYVTYNMCSVRTYATDYEIFFCPN